MRLVGTAGQARRDMLYTADGATVSTTAPLLVLPMTPSRSYLLIQNLSTATLSVDIGSARATATITNGRVTGVTVTNGGFGFTLPPEVHFMGGGGVDGPWANGSYVGLTAPNGPAPQHPALGHAVLSGGVVTSIVVDDAGANYAKPPYVLIYNSANDPYGCAAPSATTGIQLAANAPPLIWSASFCPTDPVAIFGGTVGQGFACRWSD